MENKLSEKELEVSDTFLKDAKILLESGGSLRSVMNRIYYSVFHAARAVLIRLGFDPKTHKGTIHLFLKEVAKKGLCSIDSARFLSKTFKLREDSDYDVLAFLDESDVADSLKHAEKFIEEIKRIATKSG